MSITKQLEKLKPAAKPVDHPEARALLEAEAREAYATAETEVAQLRADIRRVAELELLPAALLRTRLEAERSVFADPRFTEFMPKSWQELRREREAADEEYRLASAKITALDQKIAAIRLSLQRRFVDPYRPAGPVTSPALARNAAWSTQSDGANRRVLVAGSWIDLNDPEQIAANYAAQRVAEFI